MHDLAHIGDVVPTYPFEGFCITTELQDLIVVELDIIEDRSILMSRPKNAVGSEGNDAIGVDR